MGKREKYCEDIMVLLSSHDIKELTMEDIAEKLGITKRTLYNYFDDKQSMVREVLDLHVEQSLIYVDSIRRNESNNAVTTLVDLVDFALRDHDQQSFKFIKSVFDYYPEIFDHCDSLSRSIVGGCIIENIDKGRAEGLYHTDFNPNTIARLIFDSLESLKVRALSNDSELELREGFIDITKCLIRGIVTLKGSEILEKELKKINKQ